MHLRRVWKRSQRHEEAFHSREELELSRTLDMKSSAMSHVHSQNKLHALKTEQHKQGEVEFWAGTFDENAFELKDKQPAPSYEALAVTPLFEAPSSQLTGPVSSQGAALRHWCRAGGQDRPHGLVRQKCGRPAQSVERLPHDLVLKFELLLLGRL